MGFWSLFEVASMPILEVLLVSATGAIMATNYFNVLSGDARKSLNKIVFVAFTPSLIFASLAKTVNLGYIISWWFMPVNIGMTFLCGGTLGWIAAKLIKPKPHLEGLLIAMCSTGTYICHVLFVYALNVMKLMVLFHLVVYFTCFDVIILFYCSSKNLLHYYSNEYRFSK